MTETLEQQLEKWKRVLLVYLGAGSALALIALVDLPMRVLEQRANPATVIDGWYGLWFLLLLSSLTPGLLLLLAPRWRSAKLQSRLPTGFGFLGVAWLAMLGFSLRGSVLLPVAFHFIVAASGAVLAGGYLFLRRGLPRKEEMFP